MKKNSDRAWHALDADEALKELASSVEGLTDEEAASRLATYGPNELPAEASTSRLFLFLKQFKSALVYVLFVAAAVSFFSGHALDAAAIGLIVFANALIGYAQERKAEAAIAKLKAMVVPTVTVKRNDHTVRIESSKLVPGDIVLIAQGDRIAADLRLVSSRDLEIDEAALTGESLPSSKKTASVAQDAVLGDRSSMAFMGTLVVSGEGAGVVIATGRATAFGQIAQSLSVIKREQTPLERRVNRLGGGLAIAAVVSAGIIFFIGVRQGLEPLDMFLVAIAMAVSSIPEGLPAVLAVVLAIGVQRMARRSAITRRLPAVETLGTVDIICTDKTGTLTENQMTVRTVFTLTHEIAVTGEGWAPKGEFLIAGARATPAEHPSFLHLLRVAALCNHAAVEERDMRWAASGDPTEAALVVLAGKGGYEKNDLLRAERTLDEILFTSERKYRAILHEYVAPGDQPTREIMIIGAAEVILNMAASAAEQGTSHPLTPATRAKLEAGARSMADGALRVLAVAYKRVDAVKAELHEKDLHGLTVLGLVGMIDPPRKDVREAIMSCKRAGIRVIMNTGDHRDTAVAIAREVGILERAEDLNGKVFTDDDVVAMSDARLREALGHAAVFARVSPQTKLRIVSALQALGHTVAMTGDGINDAPALKRADIGVAMGITGTDVTKEVAEMVLTDDNFVSIVAAVEEGRIVYRNVKQTVAYLVMTNVGEVVTILAALVLALPIPLLPAQILWLNLVTDGFTGVALAAERQHGDELSQPPRRKDARMLSRSVFVLTAFTSTLMAAGTLLMFGWADQRDGEAYARTVAFLAMTFFQLWNVFSLRSVTASVFTLGFRANRWVPVGVSVSIALAALIIYVPALQKVFGLAAVGWKEWALAVVVSSSVLWLVEGWKILIRLGVIPKRWL
jgi:Ca2+-transporting ATPase